MASWAGSARPVRPRQGQPAVAQVVPAAGPAGSPSAAYLASGRPRCPGAPAASTSSSAARTTSSGTSGTGRLVRLGEPRRLLPGARPSQRGRRAGWTFRPRPRHSCGTSGTTAAGPAGRASAAPDVGAGRGVLGQRPHRRLRPGRTTSCGTSGTRRLVRLGDPRRLPNLGARRLVMGVGPLDVTVRGTDNALWQRGSTAAGPAGRASEAYSPLRRRPSSWGPNRIDVFASGTDQSDVAQAAGGGAHCPAATRKCSPRRTVAINTMVARMRDVYGPSGIEVQLASTENLNLPDPERRRRWRLHARRDDCRAESALR